MSEYTPTKEEVRWAWVRYINGSYNPEREAEFDRMIEQVRAEERERCAQIVEEKGFWNDGPGHLAAAIRAVSAEQEDHHAER